MSKNTSYDVIVVGGGLVGLLQTILLAQNGISTLCLDKQSEESAQNNPTSKRTTAISYGSRQLLKAAQLWDQIKPLACPIKSIEVLEGQSPKLLTFDLADDKNAKEADGFGWVIENHLLQNILIKTLKSLKEANYKTGVTVTDLDQNNDHIAVSTDTNQNFTATLLIGADGRQSSIRGLMGIDHEEFDYHQNAIISIVDHENPHENIAVEHFKPSGPLAILPMTDDKEGMPRSSIVWTEISKAKNSIMSWSDKAFLIGLKQQFPKRYGDITNTSPRISYPLGFIHAGAYISNQAALIGDAAHGIHPIAGQGLNLGLRDVALLTELILEAKINNDDIGNQELLNTYQKLRQPDNARMAFITDSLDKLFSNNSKIMRVGRKFGLQLFDKIGPAKKRLISQTMGTSGDMPNIIKRGKI